MHLQIDRLCKSFGYGAARKEVLREVSFAVNSGEFVALVGSSGSGKSTVMRLIAGLEQPSAGTISIDGRPVTAPGSDRGMVFQKYSLYPWLTAAQNVAFGMELYSQEGRKAARAMAAGSAGEGGFEAAQVLGQLLPQGEEGGGDPQVRHRGVIQIHRHTAHDPTGRWRQDVHRAGQQQGLLQVVGDQQGCQAGALPQVAQELLHRFADLDVEGAEGFIEQQHLRFGRQGPGDGDALLHAA